MEQLQPPPEPGSTASAAFSGPGTDQVEADLREVAGERHGGRVASLLGRLKNIKLPSFSLHMPNTPRPHMPDIPRPHMPDLSGVGEAIDQNKVGRILKGSAESYLNKFDPRGKDAKAWALGIAGGAGSVVAFAEFGATLGLSPTLRGITAAAIIHGSNAIYDRLHTAYINRAIGGFDKSGARFLNPSANMAEIRGKVIELEKSIASQKLTGQAFVDEYRLKLDGLLSPYINQDAVSKEASKDELAQKLLDRLVKLGTDYAVVNSTAKSLAAGMAAGSFTAALGEVGVRALAKGSLGTLGEHFGITGGKAPEAPSGLAPTPTATATVTGTAPAAAQLSTETATVTPTEAPTQTPTIAPTETPTQVPAETATPTAPAAAETTATPTPATTPEAAKVPVNIQEKIADIQKSPEYQVGIAAEVGKYLEARDDIVNTAIKAKDILPAEVDSASFEAGKGAALGIMEGKGNEIFENAAKEVLVKNPDADLSQITEAAQKAYADWLTSEAAQTQIAEEAQNAIANHLQIENALAEKVINTLATNQDWFQEVPIDRGATVGKILNLTWTSSDAPIMGANIAANYDTLTEMWGHMAQVRPDLLSNGNFPVSLSEINNLVERAELGDQEAIKKLRLALHWIPAGSRFRAVATNASREVLKLVA